MHDPIAKTGAWIKRQGHLNYFAVSGNHPSLWWFFNEVKRLWLMLLRRRSQSPTIGMVMIDNQRRRLATD
jgi:RNA-directed DNA polymerase